MLFNSFAFLGFFIAVYAAYLLLPHRGQNLLLLAASCIFYGVWDKRFLILLIASCFLNFILALQIGRCSAAKEKKYFLGLSLLLNLGVLFTFKYFHFFFDNLQHLALVLGWNLPDTPFRILLPIGISFYTFQKMSYMIDVYRGLCKPVRSFPDFLLYSMF